MDYELWTSFLKLWVFLAVVPFPRLYPISTLVRTYALAVLWRCEKFDKDMPDKLSREMFYFVE